MNPTITSKLNKKPFFWENRFTYTVIAASVAAILYLAFYMIGWVPSDLRFKSVTPPSQNSTLNSATMSDLESIIPTKEEPRRVTIGKIGVDTVVKNPVSTDIEILNNYLSEGAVRWPTSGYPGKGNLFIFGHSTGLSNVLNQSYKAFNDLGKLAVGDSIKVDTASGTYTYYVTDVEFKEDVAAYVPFDSGENMLTLSTCNNFGSKEDRIIVRAAFSDFSPYAN